MRNMSFALTIPQMRAGSKTVTRRDGWKAAKEGDLLMPVEKCMGLAKGEKVVQICAPIMVILVRFEPLNAMTDDLEYGCLECIKEGFPELTPEEFVAMFCKSHPGVTPDRLVNRIEFSHGGKSK